MSAVKTNEIVVLQACGVMTCLIRLSGLRGEEQKEKDLENRSMRMKYEEIQSSQKIKIY